MALTGSWSDPRVASAYASYDRALGWALGFPFVFRALGLNGVADDAPVVDVGCGHGAVARRTAELFGCPVVAADPSPAMLEIARRDYAHPRVEYRLMADQRLDLPGSVARAAYSAFVFVNLPTRAALVELAGEAARVLRPGARFCVLDVNPANAGARAGRGRFGDPGRSYSEGEPLTSVLHTPDGTTLELANYHWPAHVYTEVLGEAGFTDIRAETPTLADARGVAHSEPLDSKNWPLGPDTAPFIVVSGTRP
ncbi:class I SAM-dependent methyltransferase [Streptomonospora sp. S1-112]|uniref:Class I SAM-dependent methyltransferase n=1 Tax=Streptomonospora mangrovi TaxID=2883123 RepID=A0A9X3NI09_9ACTN|nr:class I SAM-dependent methyltransferase [Streptomonospora mangrovi]MDA0564169.1 class I SAM-dependent methyltransferase [Streptomonospora mangrovi]